jgi:lantibiotic biosynthesis protein
MWSPLFVGEEKEKMLRAVSRVAGILKEPSEAWFPAHSPETTGDATNFTLANGMAGIGTFFTYCFLSLKDEEYAERAGAYLDLALDAVENAPMPTSLFTGLSGVCWLTDHARKSGVGEIPDDLLDRIDLLLIKSLNPAKWGGHYDLISGLVGMGIYALHRLPRKSAQRHLWQIVHKLDSWSEETSSGVTWHTPGRLLHRTRQRDAPEGLYDLGLAHGVSGVISLLAQVVRSGIEAELAETLLRGAVRWVFLQNLSADKAAIFPTLIIPGHPPMDGTLAWCYGDLGVAVALFHAGRALGESEWERAALQTVHHAAEQSEEALKTRTSAAFCHGHVGIAHIFNRFFQATGDNTCRDAARWWFQKSIEDQKNDGEGIAGFISSIPDPENTEINTWPNNPSLLNGAAGIAAALLASVSDVEPVWDSLFLLNLPFMEHEG